MEDDVVRIWDKVVSFEFRNVNCHVNVLFIVCDNRTRSSTWMTVSRSYEKEFYSDNFLILSSIEGCNVNIL